MSSDNPRGKFDFDVSFGVGGNSTVVARVSEGGPGEQRAATEDRRAPTVEGWRPFRTAIVADVEPGFEYALRVRAACQTLAVHSTGVDDLIGRIEPALRLLLPDPLSGGDLEADFRLSQLSDLRPAGLIDTCPALGVLADACRSAAQPANREELSGILSRLLGPRAAPLLDLLRDLQSPVSSASPAAASPSRGASGESLLDQLLSRVDLPTSADPSARSTARVDATALGRRLTEALEQALVSTLTHPEFLRLERVLLGIKIAVEPITRGGFVEPSVVTRSGLEPGESLDNLEQLQPDWVVIEAPFGATATDCAALERWANFGADHAVPVVVTLDDSWFDATREGTADAVVLCRLRAAARRLLHSLSAKESSRWLCLTANDPCVRIPHQGRLDRTLGNFQQPDTTLSAFGFVASAMAVASLVHRRLAERGQPMPIVGEDSGRIRGLGVRIVSDADRKLAIATRFVATTDHLEELARDAVGALGPVANRDFAIQAALPMARREVGATGDLGAPVTTLGDQLLVGRLVRLLRRAVGLVTSQGVERSAAAKWLDEAASALFVDAAPAGPEVEVRSSSEELSLTVSPRRHGGLTLQTVRLARSWA